MVSTFKYLWIDFRYFIIRYWHIYALFNVNKPQFPLSDREWKRIITSCTSFMLLQHPNAVDSKSAPVINTLHWSLVPGEAACYFSTELQGVFVTQSTVSENEVTYSQINITDNAIPIWGYCHRRMENNVILMISSGTEETNCFRCFNIRLVASSKNVVRVHTTDADYISKCYTNEEKAISSCPTDADLRDPSRNTEIILYSKWLGLKIILRHHIDQLI